MEKLSPADEAELERILGLLDPIDIPAATRGLLEVKEVMDEAGVTFFLRQGTCLGAIRDNAFIPWDDDIDIGSIIGLHGLNEGTVESVARTLRERGFLLRIERNDYSLYIPIIKESIRIDWNCYRVLDNAVFMYPGIRIPVRFLTNLKEIEFLGKRFLVPNPPEEYLEVKYGPDWRIPKQAGDYEEDVLAGIPDTSAPGRAGRLKQLLARMIPRHTATVLVLDQQGHQVSGAEISVAGLGTSRANKQGIVRLYIPRVDHYALVVKFDDHRGVLFVERIGPGKSYIYRPGEEHLLTGGGKG